MPTPEQQERWHRARSDLRLEPDSDGFARAGLLANLDGPGIGVVVLPADPLACGIDFDDKLAAVVLPGRFEGLTANGVAILAEVTTTSRAIVRFARAEGGWRALVGVDRHGGVVAGVGAVARYQLDRNGIGQAL